MTIEACKNEGGQISQFNATRILQIRNSQTSSGTITEYRGLWKILQIFGDNDDLSKTDEITDDQ
jgi:hypothetical protein